MSCRIAAIVHAQLSPGKHLYGSSGNLSRSDQTSRLIYDVVPAIDVKRLAGDEPCGVVRKKGGGDPNIVNADKASCRGLRFRLVDAHDVVILYDHLAAVISHREQRPALFHQRLGEMRHADEGPA